MQKGLSGFNRQAFLHDFVLQTNQNSRVYAPDKTTGIASEMHAKCYFGFVFARTLSCAGDTPYLFVYAR